MSERQQVVLEGRNHNGTVVCMEQLAGKDQEGFWVDVTCYLPGTPDDRLTWLRIRPDGIVDFAGEHPEHFGLILSAGLHVFVQDGTLRAEDEGEFIHDFMKALQDAAENRGRFFYGPVGVCRVEEPPTKSRSQSKGGLFGRFRKGR